MLETSILAIFVLGFLSGFLVRSLKFVSRGRLVRSIDPPPMPRRT